MHINLKNHCAAAALLLLSVMSSVSHAGPIPRYIQQAVDEPTRPERDRQRDADRKPAQVIAFAGIKPGDKVGELMPGGGYFTRIFCRVVGPSGHVYATAVTPVVKRERPPSPDADKVLPNPCTNVTADSKAAADFSLPSGLDVVWTSENYHDLHNKMFGTPDMIEQHKLLTEVARLIDAGTIKTTLGRDLGKINATNLREAHRLLEEGRAIGKLVLTGF